MRESSRTGAAKYSGIACCRRHDTLNTPRSFIEWLAPQVERHPAASGGAIAGSARKRAAAGGRR